EQARLAAEPQPEPQAPTLEECIAHLPERVQRWYRSHPDFLTDPEKAAKVQYCHHVARRETGEEITPAYYDRMESMLGLAPSTTGQARPIERPPVAPAPRRTEPVRQQQRSAAPVSAPPSREPASFSTGRPISHRAPLTKEELEIAQASGISADEYQRQKER